MLALFFYSLQLLSLLLTNYVKQLNYDSNLLWLIVSFTLLFYILSTVTRKIETHEQYSTGAALTAAAAAEASC